MANTGSTSITGTVGSANGPITLSSTALTVNFTAAVSSSTVYKPTAGSNTITVPSGTTQVLIVFDTANAVVATLKGVGGDTGIALNLTGPVVIPVASSVTTFILSAAANFATNVLVTCF